MDIVTYIWTLKAGAATCSVSLRLDRDRPGHPRSPTLAALYYTCSTRVGRPVPYFADLMSDHIYFAGDPAQDSARRHLERVLRQPQPRRWPLLAAIFAGGTAFTLWRVRQNRRKKANGDGPGPTSPEPRRNP